jgi:hypothetical protein
VYKPPKKNKAPPHGGFDFDGVCVRCAVNSIITAQEKNYCGEVEKGEILLRRSREKEEYY